MTVGGPCHSTLEELVTGAQRPTETRTGSGPWRAPSDLTSALSRLVRGTSRPGRFGVGKRRTLGASHPAKGNLVRSFNPA